MTDGRHADLSAEASFKDLTGLERHLGMVCGCPFLDCRHTERPENGYAFIGRHRSVTPPQEGEADG